MSTITAYAAGATDKSVTLVGYTVSTGAPYTSGAYNTSGLTLGYRRVGTNAEVTFSAASVTISAAHTDGGFVHVNGGRYRCDIPDAAIATGADYVTVWAYGVTDVVFTTAHIDIMGADPRSATVDASAAQSAVTSSATAASTANSTNLSSITLRATSANVSGSVSTAQSAALSSATAQSTAESTTLSTVALTPSQVLSVAASAGGIHADAKKMNGVEVTGAGTSANKWRGA